MNNTILTSIIIVLVAVIGVMAFTAGGENEQVSNDVSTTSEQVVEENDSEDAQENTNANTDNNDTDDTDQTADSNDDANQSSENNLATYTSSEYGFSFEYPESATVYDANDDSFNPPGDQEIVARVEIPKTYEDQLDGGLVNYEIFIRSGRHTRPGYDEFYVTKNAKGKTFTVTYDGARGNQVPEQVFETYDIVEDSFEIN